MGLTLFIQKPERRNVRLKDYDYSTAGAYFVTICTQNRKHLFGEVLNGEIILNSLGKIVQSCWTNIPHHFPHIEIDEFIIMPNHFHGIVIINDQITNDSASVGAPLVGAHKKQLSWAGTRPAPTFGNIVGAFKSITTVECIRQIKKLGMPKFDKRLWQRNYYEHVIRDENDLYQTRKYIQENPLQWDLDPENPNAKK